MHLYSKFLKRVLLVIQAYFSVLHWHCLSFSVFPHIFLIFPSSFFKYRHSSNFFVSNFGFRTLTLGVLPLPHLLLPSHSLCAFHLETAVSFLTGSFLHFINCSLPLQQRELSSSSSPFCYSGMPTPFLMQFSIISKVSGCSWPVSAGIPKRDLYGLVLSSALRGWWHMNNWLILICKKVSISVELVVFVIFPKHPFASQYVF